jgi:DNA ligase-1
MHKPILSKTSTECIFHTLYDNSVTGKRKQWNIQVTNQESFSTINCYYGYTDGKKTETTQTIKTGKNIGKSNETTHYEQAILQASSKWNHKYDQGYKPETKNLNVEELCTLSMENLHITDTKPTRPVQQGTFNSSNEEFVRQQGTSINSVIFPMLAQDYHKHKHKVVYPCYIQPKLDGFRNLYNTTSNQNTTRQGKEFTIITQSGKLYKELLTLPKGLILDGELYTNKINFEDLGVLRKTKKLTTKDQTNLEKIEYHIYDIIDTTLTFEERHNKIKELHLENYEKLVYVPTFIVHSEKEIQDYHITFLNQGFEGTMIRNKNSFYTIKKRSYDLLKYKDFQDEEFEIIDFTFETDTSGEDKNLIVWIIKIPANIQNVICKVRPMGTKEERKNLYEQCQQDFSQFKGRKLWVKYFEKTKDGNLRFPTTKCNSYTEYIRDIIE